MSALYDNIGSTYRQTRTPEPRIYQQLAAQLSASATLLNIGAGAGSYEPRRQGVIALEPSRVMLNQRPPDAAPAVQGVAEALPFRDGAFEEGMTVLSCHHWPDQSRAFDEIGRVISRRMVFLTWDPAQEGFWLTNDYFPEIIELDRTIFPAMSDFVKAFGKVRIEPIPIPHDCVDGFLCAYWRRPVAYLDDNIRAGMSSFANISDVQVRIERLSNDIRSGQWQARNSAILKSETLDLGYRLVVIDF